MSKRAKVASKYRSDSEPSHRPVFGGASIDPRFNPPALFGEGHQSESWGASINEALKRLYDTEVKGRSFFDLSRFILSGMQTVVPKVAWTAAARRCLTMTPSRRSPSYLRHNGLHTGQDKS